MADTNKLRPEIREAVEVMDARVSHATWQPIRAELLRLAMIEADALIALDCEHDWQVEHERAEKAAAELAALKARIANSHIVEIANYGDPFIVLPDHFTVPDSLKGKRVRLVVEE